MATTAYKKQHFVPQCYMKAWHDPSALATAKVTPYVWVFDRDGSNPRRKSPSNLFTENDIYTIVKADGERDLYLEHGFQEFEDRFTRIRNLKFNRNEWPDDEQMVWLLAFVATMQARTKANRDHQRGQWSKLRQMGERMQAAYEEASPEKKASFTAMGRSSSGNRSGEGMTLEHVAELEKHPVQSMMGSVVQVVLPMFRSMNLAVLQTDDPVGFITSDHPCTWFDAEAYKWPPFYRGAGLGSASIEVTLPISPRQCLLITHRPHQNGYIDVKNDIVSRLNQRHIAHCDESFISCSPVADPKWFERPEMPDDAWEKVQERERTPGND